MSGPCCEIPGTNSFFSKHAKRYAKKFRRKGIDKPSRKLVEGLTDIGVESKSILEVGCGVGGLHLTLLKRGATSARGIDVSEGMLAAARLLAEEMGLDDKVQYHCDDFVHMNGELSPADIVVMDKVICCYEDPVKLINKASKNCRSLLAVSYPRKSWIGYMIFHIPSKLGELLRWSFRPFYHSTVFIEHTIRQEGFAEAFCTTTPIWQIQIYRRE